MSKPSAAARKPAGQTWAREQLIGIPAADLGAAVEELSARVRTVLVRWIGTAAYHTLMQRALDDVKPTYPVLSGARCEAGQLLGLAANKTAHDLGALPDGFNALVVALVDRLARVVGEEMAWRLVEQAEPLGGDTPPPIK